MNKLIVFTIIGMVLIGSVLAWTFEPVMVVPVKDKLVKIIDVDTGIKTNMSVEKVDSLKLEYAKAYAEYSKTSVDTSKIEVLSQSVKSCISFTYVKINGVLTTVISAKGACTTKTITGLPKDEEIIKEV